MYIDPYRVPRPAPPVVAMADGHALLEQPYKAFLIFIGVHARLGALTTNVL